MKTTDCVYRINPVPLGRARKRCPVCGATLQNHDPAGHHYIAPRTPLDSSRGGPLVEGSPTPEERPDD